jgi:hypothetical protein
MSGLAARKHARIQSNPMETGRSRIPSARSTASTVPTSAMNVATVGWRASHSGLGTHGNRGDAAAVPIATNVSPAQGTRWAKWTAR